jgi:two-component system, OmpR family, alkaline phosphatase synthesis response regulator PhoP
MENKLIKILLVDDEKDILEILSYNLLKEGYQVCKAKNGKEAVEKAKTELPNLIVLDLMMPEMNGIEACEIIRKIPELSATIIVFLTARNEDYSHIAGLEAGADDYIAKPIKPKLFVSKIKALLRRFKPETTDSFIIINGLTIDKTNYIILQNEIQHQIAKKEFELLNLLASKPNKVFKREEILDIIWGNDIYVGSRTIDVHIRKLRKRFGNDVIKTVQGVGYKM